MVRCKNKEGGQKHQEATCMVFYLGGGGRFVGGQPAERVKRSRVKTARFTNRFDFRRVWTTNRTGLSSCGRVFFAPLAHV